MRFKSCTTEIKKDVLVLCLNYGFTKSWLKRVVDKDVQYFATLLKEETNLDVHVVRVSEQKAVLELRGVPNIHEVRCDLNKMLAEV